jgi:glutamine amidotransferase PdxT
MKIYSALYKDFAHLDYLFPKATYEVVTKPEELDEHGILIMHGGSDISPIIYNQKPIKETQANDKLSPRDEAELALMKKAIEKGIFIYGICRGAQLACCLAGGNIIQHVTNHQNNHILNTVDIKVEANSAHHQMMDIENVKDAVLIAWTPTGVSDCYKTDIGEKLPMSEPEIVWFPSIKALAVQGHPEWLLPTNRFVRYCNNLVSKYYV